MKESFKGPSRQPEEQRERDIRRPYRSKSDPRSGPLERDSFKGDHALSGNEFALRIPAWGPDRATIEASGEAASYPAPTPIKIDFNHRFVAVVIDLLVCYLVAVIFELIPFLNRFLSLPLVMAAVFLSRDFFFQGRGFGKNLMGFQVVDAKTGVPANLLQVFIRNFILIAPEIVVAAVSLTPLTWDQGGTGSYDGISRFVANPASWNASVIQVVNIVGSIYLLIVLPMECYRAFAREDSLRKGDELAGTMIIEAPMDFSRFLPISKN
jgi:hypothetical protein